jgi:hypothetical protein
MVSFSPNIHFPKNFKHQNQMSILLPNWQPGGSAERQEQLFDQYSEHSQAVNNPHLSRYPPGIRLYERVRIVEPDFNMSSEDAQDDHSNGKKGRKKEWRKQLTDFFMQFLFGCLLVLALWIVHGVLENWKKEAEKAGRQKAQREFCGNFDY